MISRDDVSWASRSLTNFLATANWSLWKADGEMSKEDATLGNCNAYGPTVPTVPTTSTYNEYFAKRPPLSSIDVPKLNDSNVCWTSPHGHTWSISVPCSQQTWFSPIACVVDLSEHHTRCEIWHKSLAFPRIRVVSSFPTKHWWFPTKLIILGWEVTWSGAYYHHHSQAEEANNGRKQRR